MVDLHPDPGESLTPVPDSVVLVRDLTFKEKTFGPSVTGPATLGTLHCVRVSVTLRPHSRGAGPAGVRTDVGRRSGGEDDRAPPVPPVLEEYILYKTSVSSAGHGLVRNIGSEMVVASSKTFRSSLL